MRHVCVDKDGKLWLSTDKGLLCYDGNDVKIFKHDPNDASSIISNNISKAFPDSKGNVYIMSDVFGGNLGLVDAKTGLFSAVVIAFKGEDYHLMATPFPFSDLLIDDEDKSLWVACYNIGFQHYNTITARTDNYYLHDEYSGKNTVHTIKQSATNKELLWLGTEDGIYSFNKRTRRVNRNFKCSNPNDSSGADLQVMNIDVYNRDSIWFSVPGRGIGCYDIKTGYYKIFPIYKEQAKNTNEISPIQIQRKNKNEYFISTKYSLPGVFNTYTHQYDFTAVTSQDLPSVLLTHYFVDSAGNFWCVINDKLFQAHSTANKFATVRVNTAGNAGSGNAFKTIAWDEKNRVYYATFAKSKTVLVLDTNFQLSKKIPVIDRSPAKDTSEINDLCVDKKGGLWVCGNTLYTYDQNSQTMTPSNPGLLLSNHFQNVVARGDYLYLQPSDFTSRAIYRININNLVLDSITLPDEISKDKNFEKQPVKLLNYIEIDKEERNAYFGYSKSSFLGYVDCLIQLNLETKKARRVAYIDGVEHNELSKLFKYAIDDNDRIWVETIDGIIVYDPNDFHVVKKIETVPEHFSTQLYNINGRGIMCRLYSQGIMLYNTKDYSQVHLTLNDGLASYLNSAMTCLNNILFTGANNYFQFIPLMSVIGQKNTMRKCYLTSIQLFNKPYQTDTLPQHLHVLRMRHDENFITLGFSSTEFEQPERSEYRYKMDGIDKDWVYVNYLNRTISYNDMKPGGYVFHAAVRNADGNWSKDDVKLLIDIIPAWWQTDLFQILLAVVAAAIVYFLVVWRIRAVRKQEQLKGQYEKELLELEAKALRAQMNPHFIFNCMNSIKSLIQKNDLEKSILYLTTFSKLIRTIFQNSDKREISLYDEVETCRLYTELESMRFGNKFGYQFNIDKTIDLKSIMVPALILQPFIENAIWHGIMPKEDGGVVHVEIGKVDHTIRCTIDDNGVGRQISNQNKFTPASASHESKGVRLTQARLDLDNSLNERNATVEIIDKKTERGSSGTTVILNFNEY